MELRSLFARRASALALSFLTALAGCSSDPQPAPPVDAAVDVPVAPEDVFIGTGNLVLAWTVRGMPAATGCAVAGGVRVRFPANFVQFPQDTTVPCEQGELRIENTGATLAAISAELLDASGNVIHSFVTEANVRAGQTSTANIRFEPAGRLLIRWTINGMPAAMQCATVNAAQAQFRVQRSAPTARTCTAGSVTVSNVQVGPVNITGELVFNNGDRRPWPTIKTTGDVVSGEVSPVEVDFTASPAPMM
jgi:hypothetical protein